MSTCNVHNLTHLNISKNEVDRNLVQLLVSETISLPLPPDTAQPFTLSAFVICSCIALTT